MKRISTEKRNNIVSLLLQGLSYSGIAAKNKLSIVTVTNISREAHIVNLAKKSGRKSKLASKDKQLLICLFMSGKENTATDLQKRLLQDYDKQADASAIRKILKQE